MCAPFTAVRAPKKDKKTEHKGECRERAAAAARRHHTAATANLFQVHSPRCSVEILAKIVLFFSFLKKKKKSLSGLPALHHVFLYLLAGIA